MAVAPSATNQNDGTFAGSAVVLPHNALPIRRERKEVIEPPRTVRQWPTRSALCAALITRPSRAFAADASVCRTRRLPMPPQ